MSFMLIAYGVLARVIADLVSRVLLAVGTAVVVAIIIWKTALRPLRRDRS